jgi:hypothetical protein
MKLVCRSMLPRAREQQGSCADSSDSLAMQLPTRAPQAGVRVVLAGRQEPEQDGLFSDVGLTRSKDTGGIGNTQLLSQMTIGCSTLTTFIKRAVTA